MSLLGTSDGVNILETKGASNNEGSRKDKHVAIMNL